MKETKLFPPLLGPPCPSLSLNQLHAGMPITIDIRRSKYTLFDGKMKGNIKKMRFFCVVFSNTKSVP
jgi:hypothetical protein